MPNTERIVKSFRDQIIAANLPIEAEDATFFAEEIMSLNPPRGLLTRLARGLHFIDQSTFNRDLQALSEKVNKVLNGVPYAVVLSEPDKSDFWIYQQLLNKGLSPADAKYDNSDLRRDTDTQEQERLMLLENSDLPIAELVKIYKWPSPFQKWISNLPEASIICAFDDFSISGSFIRSDLFGIMGKKSTARDFRTFLIYASSYAQNDFSKFGIRLIKSGPDIRNFSDFLTKGDISFLQKVDEEKAEFQGDVMSSSALFWTWYKVPDNIPSIFKGYGMPTLVREERFLPPYKNQVTEH